MQIGGGCTSVMNKRLVVAAAGTDRARPTGVTVIALAQVVRLEELRTGCVVDAALLHMSHFPDRRIDKTMAQTDVAGRADTEQSQSRAARVGLADARMQLFDRVVGVREAVLAAFDCFVAIFPGQLFESP